MKLNEILLIRLFMLKKQMKEKKKKQNHFPMGKTKKNEINFQVLSFSICLNEAFEKKILYLYIFTYRMMYTDFYTRSNFVPRPRRNRETHKNTEISSLFVLSKFSYLIWVNEDQSICEKIIFANKINDLKIIWLLNKQRISLADFFKVKILSCLIWWG